MNENESSGLKCRKERKKITRETISTFKYLISKEKKKKEIMETLEISDSTFQKLRKGYSNGDFVDVNNFKTAGEKRSEKRKDNRALIQEISLQICACPTLTLKQLGDNIKSENSNMTVSTSTLCRTLKKMDYTRKVLTKVPINRNSNQNKDTRAQYANEICNIMDDNLVFLDETGFNLHLTPRWGYSPRNSKCSVVVPNSKGNNVSVIAAIDINGLLAYKVKIGSFNSESFVDFINNELPCIPKQQRKFLIKDNASIHKTADSKEACASRNYVAKYLPPYSPQLNPIEEFFSCLKSRYCLFPRPNKTEGIVRLVQQILGTETFHMTGYYNHMKQFIEMARNREDFI